MSVNYGGYAPPARVNFGWIGQAWQLFMAQASVWIVATLAMSALPVLLVILLYASMFGTMFPHGFAQPPVTGAGANPMLQPGNLGTIIAYELGGGLVSTVYATFFYGSLFRMAVQQVRGYPPVMKDILAGGSYFGRILGALLLLGLAGYAAEIICMAPALILTLTHSSPVWIVLFFVLAVFVIYALLFVAWGVLMPLFSLMVDGVSFVPALRRSVGAMKGQWLTAAGFVFVMGLLVYASEIPCGLGLLATVPMLFLISALVYRDMAGMPDVLPPPLPMAYSAASGVWPPPPEARPPAFGQPPSSDPSSFSPPRRSLGGEELDGPDKPPVPPPAP